ncbi:MAG: bifunctional demethylmenaquinone methyltransferase/2-methoxy-6-polyprenyl-1,4-benzoquinol methylase UbiE [Candidatus Eremiobacteraeota bacterium]|nr:bifunctional demethylmenaquinone methyltransferase/2-methoxy-6-polyprenyl-1,4-benzoquinol methylase UbiE [Candidatus Eremiobacteraeota bacterium]MBV8366425.1 bifunctional demethylmenaquinone methyltransferase/2-methoxy-6-polyprenyl-1,4-benzoquinol methylase UbiE [Candidatus Eremiobacteraeota bacterium]
MSVEGAQPQQAGALTGYLPHKSDVVRDLFDRIAVRYDRANTMMTAGMDELWRVAAADQLHVADDARLLDLCCGTGGLSRVMARKVPEGSVDAVDFSSKMLDVARARPGPRNIEWHQADVLALPFEDATFDGAAMGFSMRNIVDIGACLREVARVLKPGATFVNLEISKPPNALWRRLFYFYFYNVLPLIGGAAGGDAAAYRYLPQSLVSFPDADALAALFQADKFAHVRYVRLMGGIVAMHIGTTDRAPNGRSIAPGKDLLA